MIAGTIGRMMNAELKAAMVGWRRAAAAAAVTSPDHPYYDSLIDARDEAHSRYAEALNATARSELARNSRDDTGTVPSARRMTNVGLIGAPNG